MRTPLPSTKAQQGSILLATLLMAFLFGFLLLFYLNLVRNQTALVYRSQAWNSALAAAEAGTEEALAQLNPGISPILDRSANGWGFPAAGWYGPLTRQLSPDSSYSVAFTADTQPVIYSTGYVTLPALSATLTRVLCVETTPAALYTAALAALTNIDLNGNGLFTDSFDSADPTFSTDGRYDPARRKENGDVATLTGLINVGTADVHGDVLLGPEARGIQTNSVATIRGSVKPDFNSEFADVLLPFAALPASPAPTVIDGISYDYVFQNSGDYAITATGSIYVGPGAAVRLKITISPFEPDHIRVAGTGASAGKLEIYMAGAQFTLVGAAVVDDQHAAQFNYFGLPGNTLVTFSGQASFTGTIYAPEADLTIGDGGPDVRDFFGSAMAKSIKVNGSFSFHFDEALQRDSVIRGYLAKSWREL